MLYNYYLNFIGMGYNTTFGMVDSDILLLDISNNDEYTWTTIFEPSVQTKSSTPSTTTSSPPSSKRPNYTLIIIGAVVGSFIIGISLAFGGVFLYKWNKNKKENKQLIPITGNEQVNDTNHEVLEFPTRNVNDHGQEINNVYKRKMLPTLPIAENSTNNETYNHGNETT